MSEVTKETSLEVAKEALDLICGRFKETDLPFNEEKFRDTATFGMVNAIMRVLMSGDK